MEEIKKLYTYVDRFNHEHEEFYKNRISNEESADWMLKNIPLLDCNDAVIEETYYFRYWTFRKHIKDTPEGTVITEFLPNVTWSGPYNTISCSNGHHILEGRWLNDRTVIESYIRFFLKEQHTEHALKYTSSFLWNVYLYCRFTGNLTFTQEVLPLMIHQYNAWEQKSFTPYGLFWSNDGYDGMEYSISGSGLRPTLNTYMFGAALGISKLCRIFNHPQAVEFEKKASSLRQNIRRCLWDENSHFFKTVPMDTKDSTPDWIRSDSEHNVKEEIGFIPFLVSALTDESDECIFKDLLNPQIFYAPYGITTADMSHECFMKCTIHHECLWDGPVWPYATCQTLTALYTLLTNKTSHFIKNKDYITLLHQYAASQKLYAHGELINWIDENIDPFSGQWVSRDLIYLDRAYHCFPKERGADYNHSTYCDLVLSGACGILPDTDIETGKQSISVKPLCIGSWDYFSVKNIFLGGSCFEVYYDATGSKFGFHSPLTLIRDGKVVATGTTELAYTL